MMAVLYCVSNCLKKEEDERALAKVSTGMLASRELHKTVASPLFLMALS